jgi:hypothetical protein
MNKSRIPAFERKTLDGMAEWFEKMSQRDLLFHPDDLPEDIFTIKTGEPAFSSSECRQLRNIMNEMFELFGGGVHDMAYPVFMACMGIAA